MQAIDPGIIELNFFGQVIQRPKPISFDALLSLCSKEFEISPSDISKSFFYYTSYDDNQNEQKYLVTREMYNFFDFKGKRLDLVFEQDISAVEASSIQSKKIPKEFVIQSILENLRERKKKFKESQVSLSQNKNQNVKQNINNPINPVINPSNNPDNDKEKEVIDQPKIEPINIPEIKQNQEIVKLLPKKENIIPINNNKNGAIISDEISPIKISNLANQKAKPVFEVFQQDEEERKNEFIFNEQIKKDLNLRANRAKEDSSKKNIELLNKNLTDLEKELFGKAEDLLKAQSKISLINIDNFEREKNIPLERQIMYKNCKHEVICNGCNVCPIKGIRYKCVICDNLNYCEKCEKEKSGNHEHPFLKLIFPLEEY